MKTVESLQLVQLLERCESLGANPVRLRRAAGLTPALVAAPDGRLPWDSVSRLLAQAQRETGDPLFGLRAARSRPPRGLLIYQFRAQDTLEEALAQLARNIQLAADPVSVEVCIEARRARVVLSVDDGESDSLASIREYVTGSILWLLEAAVPSFLPLGISFPHAPRGPISEYEKLLGAAPRFREADCEISFSPRLCALPIPSANPAVARMVAEMIERRLAARRAASFRAGVEAVLEDLLGKERPRTVRTRRGSSA